MQSRTGSSSETGDIGARNLSAAKNTYLRFSRLTFAAALLSEAASTAGLALTPPAKKHLPTPEKVVAEHIAALNACDWNRMMAQYDDNIEFLSKDGGIVKGRKAIGHMFRKALQPPSGGGQCGMKLIPEHTVVIGDTVKGPWDIGSASAGLDPSAIEWLHKRDAAFLVSDAAHDAIPSAVERVDFRIHVLAIVAMGMALADQCNLEDIAREAQTLHRYTFLLTLAPVRIEGGDWGIDQPDRSFLTAHLWPESVLGDPPASVVFRCTTSI